MRDEVPIHVELHLNALPRFSIVDGPSRNAVVSQFSPAVVIGGKTVKKVKTARVPTKIVSMMDFPRRNWISFGDAGFIRFGGGGPL